MQINNPLQINDWEIKKFLKVILAIQLAMWCVIGLDAIGLQIPILRQLIGFIYLTFVPGIIILRILKLHKLGNIETLLYTVGLSITTLMLTGLFMNMVYPIFGISGPISLTPLIITISVVILVLCILNYVRDKNFSEPSYIDIKNVLSPPVLFLCLIPFLVILGTYLVNFYHTNILLMLLIVVLALIVVLIGFDKFIPKNLYPLAIFVIALSLLFHNSLISMYIWGCDINYELYLTNSVKMNSIWDPTIHCVCNAMLGLVMLAPIYSIITNMHIAWVFKIIYPLLFSLAPLGLYRVFQKQTNDKIAFLACFFFVSLSVFYIDMLALARQQIAELFLVILVLLMIDKNMDKIKRSLLFIVFGISLVISHYGLSYIYMFCLIAAWLILILIDNPEMQRLGTNFQSKFGRAREKLARNPISLKVDRTIRSTFVLFFITFALSWYMYVSSSSTFNVVVEISNHIANSIFTDFLNPEAAEGLDIITREMPSPLHIVTKYLHLLSQFFIAIGVLTLMLNRKGTEMKFEREYEAFSLVSFVICLAGIAVPYFASALNTTRLYQITLIFLAPFCVIGGVTVFKMINKVVKTPWTNQRVKCSLKVLSVFFAIFLLFNSGWAYAVANYHSGSISLSHDKLLVFRGLIHEQDMVGAEWLAVRRDNSLPVYADVYTHAAVTLWAYGFIPKEQVIRFFKEPKEIMADSYVFLNYVNVAWDAIFLFPEQKPILHSLHNTTFFQVVHNHKNKIYDNGGNIYV